MNVDAILDRALSGKRVSNEEGVFLYEQAPLESLGVVANELNLQKNPRSGIEATFVVDFSIHV